MVTHIESSERTNDLLWSKSVLTIIEAMRYKKIPTARFQIIEFSLYFLVDKIVT